MSNLNDWKYIKNSKPSRGDEYYFIKSDGSISSAVKWSNNYTDTSRWLFKNCYESLHEAKYARERLLIHAELQRYADENNSGEPVWFEGEEINWCIVLSGDLFPKSCNSAIDIGVVYFTSEEVCASAIEYVGKERIMKYCFGVKPKDTKEDD